MYIENIFNTSQFKCWNSYVGQSNIIDQGNGATDKSPSLLYTISCVSNLSRKLYALFIKVSRVI
jgi:hypothetical protein